MIKIHVSFVDKTNYGVETVSQVTIKCTVRAIPVAEVTWTKDGGPIHSRHKINGTDLVLSEESGTTDSGRYRCSATNPLGRDAASSLITFLSEL